MNNLLQWLKLKSKSLKKEIVVIFLAFRYPKTPRVAKVLAALTLAYALSPIDLIPDFIPVVGLLDDIIIVPLFIKLSLSFIPKYVLQEIRNSPLTEIKLAKKWWYALPVIFLYGLVLYFSLKYYTSIL